MSRNTAVVAAVLVLVGMVGFAPLAGAAGVDKAALAKALQELPSYDWGKDRGALDQIEKAVVAAHGDVAVRADLEKRLAGVLGSGASRAVKDFACRQLSLIGTSVSVPALAALLPDKDLSHMARYALERIGDPAAVKAMREALPKVSGLQKVGVINSLGMREDAGSAGALLPLLGDSDPQIVAAAAAALGRIGTPEAAVALLNFKAKAPAALQVVAADACLNAAARALKRGQADAAAKIYETLDSDKEPEHVRMAAFRGMVAAKPTEATPRLVKALAGDDEGLRSVAVFLMLESPGSEATKAFAAALPQLPPVGQVALLKVLQERGDPAARPAVLDVMKSTDEGVRVASLKALCAVGGAADVTVLAGKVAAGADAEKAVAAEGLVLLKGDDVNAAIVAAIKGADAGARAALVRSLGARSAAETVATVMECAKDSDAGVRLAALESAKVLAGEGQAPALVSSVKSAKDDAERKAAEEALLAVCGRGREKCAAPVIAGLSGADAASRMALLRALGRAGGPQALQAVQDATKDADASVQDEAVRVLAGWSDASAVPVLLALAKSAAKESHQILALRGYVRLAGEQPTDDAKLKMLTEAMKLAKRPEDKKLVLGALSNVQTVESLRLVVPCLGDAALAEEASAAAVKIAGKVADSAKDLTRDAMQKVLQQSKNDNVRKEAEMILKKVGG
ncbi:MAG: HEAT repeat domain-containing protein [Phycisphaerae bacterium]